MDLMRVIMKDQAKKEHNYNLYSMGLPMVHNVERIADVANLKNKC
jgi:hypothetical protein